jgi:chemotaxis response regulator CheB
MTIEPRARKAGTARPRLARGASRQREAPFRPDDFLVVGLGASAGRLEALDKLFDALPPDTGMAFILIQHLDSDLAAAAIDTPPFAGRGSDRDTHTDRGAPEWSERATRSARG